MQHNTPGLERSVQRVKLLDPAQEHYVVGRVSVIMPIWNATSFLTRAVCSVLAQTYTDWELLMVDDGSTDQSWELMASLQKRDLRIRAISHQKNLGAPEARNSALRAASGQYIAFLDADDSWHPEKLCQQIAFMARSGAVFSHTAFWRVQKKHKRLVPVPEFYSYEQLLRFNVIGCLTAIYDRAYFGSVPMPTAAIRHDTALWFTLLQKTAGVYGHNTPLATHYHHAASLSANQWRAQRESWRLFREFVGLGVGQSLYCQASHLWNRVRRG